MKQTTSKELEKIMIDQLGKIEDCQGVKSIGFYNITEPGIPNWEPSIINYGDADKLLCDSALPRIITKLQAEYELIPGNA
jgi:hypothetical protein